VVLNLTKREPKISRGKTHGIKNQSRTFVNIQLAIQVIALADCVKAIFLFY
jgi:hypothetical protein